MSKQRSSAVGSAVSSLSVAAQRGMKNKSTCSLVLLTTIMEETEQRRQNDELEESKFFYSNDFLNGKNSTLLWSRFELLFMRSNREVCMAEHISAAGKKRTEQSRAAINSFLHKSLELYVKSPLECH